MLSLIEHLQMEHYQRKVTKTFIEDVNILDFTTCSNDRKVGLKLDENLQTLQYIRFFSI